MLKNQAEPPLNFQLRSGNLLDLGKINLQLIANEENQDRAQCGKTDAGGMISLVCRARKHVGNGAADDRSDDAEHDRPEDRHVHVHQR